jgi:rod shape-determining protein MreC
MKRLLHFVRHYRGFIVFVLLELVSSVLIFQHHFYQTSTSHAIGSIQHFVQEFQNYPFLRADNSRLLHDNARLKKKILEGEKPLGQGKSLALHCGFTPATVINNSIVGTKNYLTLNKGALDGIAAGMGVVGAQGIVGSIKAVSDHFATVTSLLHTSVQVSAQIETSKVLGTVQWPGRDPFRVEMRYVPRHFPVAVGDKVVTSGYNATFPEGSLIGYITQVKLSKEAAFYDIEIEISTDFSTLRHVYVLKNGLKGEKDALEQRTKDFYD